MTRRFSHLLAASLMTWSAVAAPRAAAQESSAYQPATVPAATAAAAPLQVAAPAPGGVANQPGGVPAQAPAPPFQLNDIEQQFVLQTLQMWEGKSKDIKTFRSQFELWQYDKVFGGNGEDPMIKSTGTLSYSKPDKGSFKIDKISRWTKKNPQDTAADAPGDWVPQPDEIGEHWVCDGKAVYEYNERDKQLVVTPIPEEMRGASIVDGPLPFLFGAEANKLMHRYWIRSHESTPERIWLVAHPRWQADAANYDSVEVMLERKTMQPTAILVHLPGGQQRDVYMFQEPKINGTNLDALFGGLFASPRTPIGWTRVMANTKPGPQAAKPPESVQR